MPMHIDLLFHSSATSASSLALQSNFTVLEKMDFFLSNGCYRLISLKDVVIISSNVYRHVGALTDGFVNVHDTCGYWFQ